MCVCLFVCVNLYGCNTVTFLECLEAATAFRDCAESMLPCCDPGLSISALPLLLQRRHAESDMGTKRFKECLCVWLSVGFMKVFSVSSELLSDCIPRCIDLPLWSSVSSSSALLTRTIHGIAYVPTRYWLQFEPGKCKPRTSQLITLTEPLLGYIMGRYEKHWETIENMEEKSGMTGMTMTSRLNTSDLTSTCVHLPLSSAPLSPRTSGTSSEACARECQGSSSGCC